MTPKKCSYVIKFYDKDLDDKLIFKEFLRMILPVDNPKLREEVVQRENYSIGKDEPLPYNVEYALARIVNKEIEMCTAVEKEKAELLNRYDFNVQVAFKSIDGRHTRFITFDILAAYLKKRGTNAQAEDVAAFMRRVDQDLDCKISYNEFVAAMLPVDPKTRTKPSYITPTKAFQSGYEQNGGKGVIRSRTADKKVVNKSFSAAKKTMTTTPIKPSSRGGIKSQSRSRRPGTEKKKTFETPLRSSHKKVSPLKKTPGSAAKLEPAFPREYTVYDLMGDQLSMEKKIELMKQDLAVHSDVTISRICAVFDPDLKGCIGAVDLLETLRRLGLSPERESAYLVFSRFDRDMDGKLEYSDVSDMIMPIEEEYASVLLARVARETPSKLSNDSITVLQRLMQTYLDSEKENEQLKAKLGSLDVRKAFEECDIEDVGFFTSENVK